ncbi:hypothetical protein GCM10023191_076900 [Actinoallomurus oryzae]|uniref:Uncharacterized protein n=1 Tax=Actinoallomurus oryzae TaxID=502180 RepID=A0ABP8QWK2_9ACTN
MGVVQPHTLLAYDADQVTRVTLPEHLGRAVTPGTVIVGAPHLPGRTAPDRIDESEPSDHRFRHGTHDIPLVYGNGRTSAARAHYARLTGPS